MKALFKVFSHPVYRIRKTFVILECILKEEKEIGERARESGELARKLCMHSI